MRQVNKAELVWKMKYALSRISRDRFVRITSRENAVHRIAVQMLAEELVDALGSYEVLSQAPEPEGDLFTKAAYRDR